MPPPNGLRFIEGQTFNASGIQVLARFFNVEKTPSITTFTYSAEPLTLNDTEFEIRYTHAGIERVTAVPIAVAPKTLQSIEITHAPTTVAYTEGKVLAARVYR